MSNSCDRRDCSRPGSSDHEILQARILDWVAISFSGDLPDPGIEPWSPALQANSLLTELQGKIASFWCHFIFTFPGNGSLALEARFRLTFLPESFTAGALSWVLNHWTTREVPGNNYFTRACKYGAFLLESLFYK